MQNFRDTAYFFIIPIKISFLFYSLVNSLVFLDNILISGICPFGKLGFGIMAFGILDSSGKCPFRDNVIREMIFGKSYVREIGIREIVL